MPVEDAEMTRSVRRDISRRYVDCANLDVRVIHGIVYLAGYLERLRGHDTDLHEELQIILRILRQRPGIRDVICECELGRPGMSVRAKAADRAKRRS
jgi:hypothetical protein